MRTTTLIPVEEYLSTGYSPDVDYVDGAIEERNVGEKWHSLLQRRLTMALSRYGNIQVWPEQRVQVQPTRYRVPDICVTLREPDEQIFTSPPFICIEILSSEDPMNRTVRKLHDYQQFGIPFISQFDPWNRKSYRYSSTGLAEVGDENLTTGDPLVVIDLKSLFEGIG